MANSLDLASIFQSTLDEQMVQELVTVKMEANPKRVQHNGGATVKILKMSTTGLGTYSRAGVDGRHFPAGAVTTEWQDFTFQFDRATEFVIDSQDNDEQFVDIASMTMGDFQKGQVVPEVDACRFATIWAYALGYGNVSRYTAASATILSEMKSNIKSIRKVVGRKAMTLYISYDALDALDLADEISHDLNVNSTNTGGIETRTRSLDGVPIIEVPDDRFFSEVTLSATNGFTNPSTASALNWVIVVDEAVTALAKQDKMRIFSPDVNQDADAWKLQYRKYHGCWVTDNALPGIYVSYTGVDAPELTATVAAGTGTGNTKFTATAGTGNTLGYILGAASPAAKYLDLIDNFAGSVEPYTSGADIAATEGQLLTMCKVNADGRIIELKEVTLASGDISA